MTGVAYRIAQHFPVPSSWILATHRVLFRQTISMSTDHDAELLAEYWLARAARLASSARSQQQCTGRPASESKLMDIRAIRTCIITRATTMLGHEVVGVVWRLDVIAFFCLFLPPVTEVSTKSCLCYSRDWSTGWTETSCMLLRFRRDRKSFLVC
jgi:hypothetical protein